MLFFLIWLVVLGASGYFFHKSSGSLSLLKPNLNSIIFYYSFVLSSYIGTLLIANGVDDYYMINRMTHEEYRAIGFYTISFVVFVFPLIQFLVSKVIGFNANVEYNRYLKKEISLPFKEKNEFFLIFLGLAGLSLLAILYTLWKSPYIPILEVVKGGGDLSPGELRNLAQRGFQGNVLIRNIFAIALTPLLSLIAFVYAVKTRRHRWILLFLSLFAGSVLINTYDLAKSPIFFYFIMFILIGLYVGKIRITARRLTIWGILGAVVLVGMYVVIQGVTDVESFLSYNSGPVGRMILAQISPTFLHLNLFSESLPLLNGQGLPSSFIGLFDVDQVRSARLVMTTVFPEKVAEGTAGVLNTLFVAEAFANFGYIGVVAGTVYVAVMVQLLYIAFIRLPKNPIFLSLFVYFTVNIPRTLVGGFTDFIFNPIWTLMVGLFVGILLFIRVRLDLTSYLIQRKRSRQGN